MKKIIAIAVLTAVTTLAASAQTTNTFSSPVQVFENIAQWTSTYNTNAPGWGNIILWDGPIYQAGVNIANELGGSIDLWKESNVPAGGYDLFLAFETRERQGAIGGVFVSEQAGGEFGFEKYDLRFGVYADGGYRSSASLAVSNGGRLYGEGGLFADKQISTTTTAGLFIAEQTGTSSAPLVGVQLNVSFGSITGFFQML